MCLRVPCCLLRVFVCEGREISEHGSVGVEFGWGGVGWGGSAMEISFGSTCCVHAHTSTTATRRHASALSFVPLRAVSPCTSVRAPRTHHTHTGPQPHPHPHTCTDTHPHIRARALFHTAGGASRDADSQPHGDNRRADQQAQLGKAGGTRSPALGQGTLIINFESLQSRGRL